jgi:hypothetical protein
MALTIDGGTMSKETTRLKTPIVTVMARGRDLNSQRLIVEQTISAFINSLPQVVNGTTYMSILPTVSGHFTRKDKVGPTLYTESTSFEVMHT